MTVAYDITHCIYCGRKDFISFEDVIKHVKKEHRSEDIEEGKKWGNIS